MEQSEKATLEMTQSQSYIGEKFGRWVVLGGAPERPGNHKQRVLVRCTCGTERAVEQQTPRERMVLAYATSTAASQRRDKSGLGKKKGDK